MRKSKARGEEKKRDECGREKESGIFDLLHTLYTYRGATHTAVFSLYKRERVSIYRRDRALKYMSVFYTFTRSRST